MSRDNAVVPMPMPLSLETITRVRQAYVDGGSPREICRDFEITPHELEVCLDGGPPGMKPRLPPVPRRGSRARQAAERLTGNRKAVVRRLWVTAERQVRDIESRLILDEQEPAERERDARLMAVLVKTLCELSALDGAKPAKFGTRGAAKSSPAAPEHHDDISDDGPRDIEEFRRELARRIAALAADATTDPAGEPESPDA